MKLVVIDGKEYYIGFQDKCPVCKEWFSVDIKNADYFCENCQKNPILMEEE